MSKKRFGIAESLNQKSEPQQLEPQPDPADIPERFTTYMSENLQKRVKIQALLESRSIHRVISEAVTEYLEKNAIEYTVNK